MHRTGRALLRVYRMMSEVGVAGVTISEFLLHEASMTTAKETVLKMIFSWLNGGNKKVNDRLFVPVPVSLTIFRLFGIGHGTTLFSYWTKVSLPMRFAPATDPVLRLSKHP